MTEIALTPRAAIGGYARAWTGARLEEAETAALVSLAGAFETAAGISLPGPGRFAAAGGTTAYWMGPDQWFLAAPDRGLLGRLQEELGKAAALTDQSDGWAMLRFAGPAAPSALERLCPLDLGAFPTGAAARTVMEHIGVAIAREDDGPTYLLMTPRSSARSFLHALETAAESALG